MIKHKKSKDTDCIKKKDIKKIKAEFKEKLNYNEYLIGELKRDLKEEIKAEVKENSSIVFWNRFKFTIGIICFSIWILLMRYIFTHNTASDEFIKLMALISLVVCVFGLPVLSYYLFDSMED